MKAAVLYSRHHIKIEDIPIPSSKPGFLLVKVAYCGICGTDVHLYNGDEGSDKAAPEIILGHELSGTLADTGERVTVDPNYFCNNCSKCLKGHPHYCENIFNTGVTVNGGFAEYVLVHKSQIHKIPENVSLESAAFAEPISCCIHGADLTDLASDDRVLIIGAGTIGLIMLQICKSKGVSYTSVLEPVAKKRDTALKLGADSVFDSAIVTSSKLKKCNFNKIIECSGNINAVKTAIDSCANTGTVMLFGLTHPKDSVSIQPFDLFKRELTIKASYINPNTISRAIDLMSSKIIDTSCLLFETIDLNDLPSYLGDSNAKLKNGKVLIRF